MAASDRLNAGDRFRVQASTWNRMVDAAEAYSAGLQGNRVPLAWPNTDAGVVLVRNDTGADLDQFSVVGIDGFAFDPAVAAELPQFKRRAILGAATPVEGTHDTRLAILQEPLADGAIGRAVVCGVTPVQITVAAGETWMRHARLVDGESGTLDLCSWGYRVLEIESGAGTKWAYVAMGSVGTQAPIHGVLDGALSDGDSATMSVWTGDPLADSGENITVHDRFINGGDDLEASTRVWAVWAPDGHKHYVMGASC